MNKDNKLNAFLHVLTDPITIFILLFLLIAVPFIIIIIYAKPSVPEQKAAFESDPLVIICDDSQYSLQEVYLALEFWEKLGYKFVDVIDKFPCDDGIIDGAITIQLADQDFDDTNLAVTKVLIDEDSQKITAARIQVFEVKDRVLEHELGHALGWEHYTVNGHIMNPARSNGGLNAFGMEKK